MEERRRQEAPLALTGDALGLADVLEVAREGRAVVLADEAKAAMRRSRAVVDRLLEARVKVYGLTTGFGSKKNVFIEPAETRQLQRNLIRSHSCGVGDALDEDVVRATIALRANTLARGMSGVRVEVVEAFLALLNSGLYPWIPSQGSLGASGDLAPLSHLALVLTGDPSGRVALPRAEGEPLRVGQMTEFVPSSAELLRAHGLEPVALEAKEGLALNNGTQVMTAIGLLTLADADDLVVVSEGACAMAFEALKGVLDAFDPRLHAARPHPGQVESARRLRGLTRDSQILRVPLNMASINAAARALGDAAFFLSAEASPLAEDLCVRLREAVGRLDTLRDAPEAPLEGVEAHAGLEAYRRALEPAKSELSVLYRALISSRFATDEARLAQRSLAEALGHLEEAVPAMPPVQDNYSLRCAPQVLGAVRHALDHARRVLLTEANSTTDNPLIFPPERTLSGAPLPLDDMDAYRQALDPQTCRRAVCSGGNFHGEPVALVMDYMAVALAELGNIAERRVAHLVDGHLNQGLPSLLIYKAGLNSGFMIPQYTAASLVSENKTLAHPASVDSIPSCENTEDHVSMGTIAARKARQIVRGAQEIVAIELFTAFQALHFRAPLRPGVAARGIAEILEGAGVRFVDQDRPLYEDVATIVAMIRDRTLPEAVEGWAEGAAEERS